MSNRKALIAFIDDVIAAKIREQNNARVAGIPVSNAGGSWGQLMDKIADYVEANYTEARENRDWGMGPNTLSMIGEDYDA